MHENTELPTYFYILLCFQEEIGCEVSCSCKQWSSERWREKKKSQFCCESLSCAELSAWAAVVPKLWNLADLLSEVSPD